MKFQWKFKANQRRSIELATLDKFLSKEVVVEKPSGIAEAPTAKELKVYPDIASKFLLSDTSQKATVEKHKDPRQQSKIICQWQEPCADKENQFCYFRGKYCNQQARVRE